MSDITQINASGVRARFQNRGDGTYAERIEPLGTPGTARVQATSGTAATVTLTASCRRVSMFATQGTWYAINATATVTATVFSHFIGAGERLDFCVPPDSFISVLQEATAGSVRITELV